MSKPFHFKQFSVTQAKSAFKVGTDGVLLGAWVHPNENSAKAKALDIGTGTGLLALMLAQKNYAVTAVEPHEDSAAEALSNFKASQWAADLILEHTSIQAYANTNASKFDVIVCNPPYFQNSLVNPNQTVANARHNTTLQFNELANSASRSLKPNGWFYVVLPIEEYKLLAHELNQVNLFENKRLLVFPTPNQQPQRICGGFQKTAATTLNSQEVIIENGERHNYHESYIALTKEFYLKF
jgi:tRNA1Val (adenine37-N6)-methyltransferase